MRNICLLSILILLLTSCVTTQIVDEIQLVSSISFDYEENDMIRGTANITVHKWKDEIETETISASSATTKDIGYFLNTKSAKPIHTGKLSSMIFSEELARNIDLLQVIDTFTRNPTVGRRLVLAITSGPASDLYLVEKELEKDISQDILQLINQNIERQNIPKSNLHLFLKQVHEVGQTPFLPYLSEVDQLIQVTGIALLERGRFIHKLNLDEAFTLKLLAEKFSSGTLETSLPDGEQIVVRNIISRAKYDIDKNTNRPNILIDLYIKGVINEYTGEIINDRVIKEANIEISKQVEKDIKKLLRKLQELELDPVGIGNRVRASNRNFDFDEWSNHYKDMSFDVKVRTVITGHGISK